MSSAPTSGPARGLLLVNLGSPAEPTPAAVRAFLDEFLGDAHVVDLNRALWWVLRRLLILPRRATPVALLYKSIWTPDGSPLIVNGRRLAKALGEFLGEPWKVVVGMRYGTPGLAAGVAELERAGCREVLVLPLFPQESGTTTGTIRGAVAALAARSPGGPNLRVLAAYPDHPAYIAALAQGVRAARAAGPVDHLVFSFHGLPVRYVRAGDPYQGHCERTAAALARALELGPQDWSLSYQSRFGGGAWLQPASEDLVPGLARRAPRVLIAMPGFAADCLETLEEIGQRLADSFRAAGGLELRCVPCLNDHPAWVRSLAQMVREAWDRPRES